MSDTDLIIGIHSIAHAIKNTLRIDYTLHASKEGLADFKKYYKEADTWIEQREVKVILHDRVQEQGEKIFRQFGNTFQRIPGNIFLTCSRIEFLDNQWLETTSKMKPTLRLIALDQVSDLHNGAAIMRTAAFYGVDALIIPQKGAFSLTPSFYRISSGAVEYINIVKTNNLGKSLQILERNGVTCLGFSERGEEIGDASKWRSAKTCLIHGSEEEGLSNSVERTLKHILRLPLQGPIHSLNVSVAAAVTMEKFFS